MDFQSTVNIYDHNESEININAVYCTLTHKTEQNHYTEIWSKKEIEPRFILVVTNVKRTTRGSRSPTLKGQELTAVINSNGCVYGA